MILKQKGNNFTQIYSIVFYGLYCKFINFCRVSIKPFERRTVAKSDWIASTWTLRTNRFCTWATAVNTFLLGILQMQRITNAMQIMHKITNVHSILVFILYQHLQVINLISADGQISKDKIHGISFHPKLLLLPWKKSIALALGFPDEICSWRDGTQ